MSVTGAAEGAGLMVVKLSAVAGKSYQVAVGQMVGCPTEIVEVCKTNSSRWFQVDPP